MDNMPKKIIINWSHYILVIWSDHKTLSINTKQKKHLHTNRVQDTQAYNLYKTGSHKNKVSTIQSQGSDPYVSLIYNCTQSLYNIIFQNANLIIISIKKTRTV
jgi:uncharacterized protein YcsI (UPF0317 family)